jgi:hypothetical protein
MKNDILPETEIQHIQEAEMLGDLKDSKINNDTLNKTHRITSWEEENEEKEEE